MELVEAACLRKPQAKESKTGIACRCCNAGQEISIVATCLLAHNCATAQHKACAEPSRGGAHLHLPAGWYSFASSSSGVLICIFQQVYEHLDGTMRIKKALYNRCIAPSLYETSMSLSAFTALAGLSIGKDTPASTKHALQVVLNHCFCQPA